MHPVVVSIQEWNDLLMKDNKDLKKFILLEIDKLNLREDLIRSIPDFVLQQIASEASEKLKGHLIRFINQSSSDSSKRRQMTLAAREILDELEKEMKELLEEKLSGFNQNI